MKAGPNSLSLLVCGVLVIGAGAANGNEGSADEPSYAGRPLSSWVDEVAAHAYLWQAASTNCLEIRAVRAMGTNAIPWLLSEMENQRAAGVGNLHQLRATAGFSALGEVAAPAIPTLIGLVEKQPDWVPRALAGIGLPGLTALWQCLTNAPRDVPPYLVKKIPSERAAVSALAALFVAIDDGRIPKSHAAYLLPDVRAWAKDTNREAAYWADGVLRKLGEEQ